MLLISTLFFGNSVLANIFRVNSSLATAPAQKLFKTLQEANDASVVVNGDTLMIEGSALEYTNATLSKRLVLIGPGYFLSENPQTQASPLKAVVRQITLNTGSSGSVLVGLTFSNGYYLYAPEIKVNNIVVMRCYLPNNIQLTGNVNNIQIRENFFNAAAIVADYYQYTFTGVELKNNVIGGNINIPSSDTYQRVFSAVENNIFLGNVLLTTSTFRSNIIVKSSGTVTVSSSKIQNNLVSNNQLPLANGNQTYDPSSLFAGATGNSTDGQYKLKPSSTYLTAGYNGTQPGIFGGSEPYVLSGLPAVPSIYEFAADGFASKNTGLPIQIKVKANQ